MLVKKMPLNKLVITSRFEIFLFTCFNQYKITTSLIISI